MMLAPASLEKVLKAGSKVLLQIPNDLTPEEDDFLKTAPYLIPDSSVYFSAGSSSSDCCVNYVAAAHVDADIIIKLEPNCCPVDPSLSQVVVIGRKGLQPPSQVVKSLHTIEDSEIFIVSDEIFPGDVITELSRPKLITQIDILEAKSSLRGTFVAIGLAQWKLNLLSLLVKNSPIFYLTDGRTESFSSTRILSKRFAQLDKLATCQSLGILIQMGTNQTNRLATMLSQLVGAAGIASYLFSSESVTATKLGNFPSVDGWVVLGCPKAVLDDEFADLPGFVITAFELMCFCKVFDFWADEYTLDPQKLLDKVSTVSCLENTDCQELVQLNSSYSVLAISEMTFQGIEAACPQQTSDSLEVEIKTGRFGLPKSYSGL